MNVLGPRSNVYAPALFVVVASVIVSLVVNALGLSPTVSALVVSGLLGLGVFLLASSVERTLLRSTRAIAEKLRAREISAIAPAPDPAFDPIFTELLDIGAELRRREQEVLRGEALLAAIVEMTPAALLLLGSNGAVMATNEASRTLFFDGEDVRGQGMVELLRRAPTILRRVLSATGDELFVVDDGEGISQTHHLTKRYFELGGDDVVLVMVSNISREVSRQEIDVYKRVIRVLSHEVNNSLAPISSLMHSARLLLQNEQASRDRLVRVFDTVAERAEHLRKFLAGYSELARLPLPQKAAVDWAALFERIGDLYPGVGLGPRPTEPGWLDRTQLEQVIVNLVKNAEEAGSPREQIEIAASVVDGRGTRIVVKDRGRGMAPDVMKNALVPLFTTKENGSGVGLAICREIVDAHGGTLRLIAREGGGLEVVIRLPPQSKANVRSLSGPLTLTHTEARAVGESGRARDG